MHNKFYKKRVLFMQRILFFNPFKLIFLASILLAAFLLSPAISSSGEFSAEDIVRDYSNSIVVIGTVGAEGPSVGSGFIVSPDGLIVTNFHVVQAAMKIGVKLKSGRTFENVRLVRSDSKTDIAILKVDAQGLNPVVLGDSSAVAIGEKVVAIGNPLGLETSVSDGLISSWRQVNMGFKVLQISTPISHGSSGGPLFNLRSEVIGVTVGTNVRGQNINFAIPINYAKANLVLYKEQLASVSGSESRRPTTYKVKPKDTLFSVAKRFDTSVQALMEFNKLTDTAIFAGQRLKIPRSR